MWLISLLVIIILVTIFSLIMLAVSKSVSEQYEVSSMAYFNCDIKKLWGLVTDFPNQAIWRTGIIKVEKISDISDTSENFNLHGETIHSNAFSTQWES